MGQKKQNTTRWSAQEIRNLNALLELGWSRPAIANAPRCSPARAKSKIKRDEYFALHSTNQQQVGRKYESTKDMMGFDRSIKCPDKYMKNKMKKVQYGAIHGEAIRRHEGY